MANQNFNIYVITKYAFNLIIDGFKTAATLVMLDKNLIKIIARVSQKGFIKSIVRASKTTKIISSTLAKLYSIVTVNLRTKIIASTEATMYSIVLLDVINHIVAISKATIFSSTTIDLKTTHCSGNATVATYFLLSTYDPNLLSSMDGSTLSSLDHT